MSDVRPNRVNASAISRGQRAAFAVAALSLSLLPWFLAADDQSSARREANQKLLNEMTVPERQRLEENFRMYREMRPEERDRLRKLQNEIANDPELKAAFVEYQAWANSLSPMDRHELRQARDPETRRQLIEKFRRRPPPPESQGPPGSDRPNGPFPFGPNFVGRADRPRLLEKLFGRNVPIGGDRLRSSVPEMQEIVRVLEKELPRETQDELRSLDDFTRDVRVVRLTLERHPGAQPVAVRLFGPPGSPLFDKVLDALPNGQVKQIATNRNPAPMMQRSILLMALIRGLMTETQRNIEDHPFSPEMLRRYEDKLSYEDRQRLKDLNREDHQLELQQLYLKENVPGIAELQKLLGLSEMERFFQEFNQLRVGPMPPEGEDRRGTKGRQPPPDGAGRPRD